MSDRLAGRVAVVTGSSSGNGRAIARRLAGEGAAVVCADVRKQARPEGYEHDLDVDTDDLIAAAGGSAAFVSCDVSRSDDVEAAVAAAVERFGRLDIMVNNAGVAGGDAGVAEEPESDYDRIMGVNAKGVWLGCRHACRRLVEQGEGGRIVNIASIGGVVGLAGESAYSASKGAVVNLTRQVAIDMAPQRINCNAICPGYLETAMTRPFYEDGVTLGVVTAMTPWPRLGVPEDIAKAALFLASDDAEWVTGSTLVVDGGYTAR
jgi:NAD(P)-dependent dehydrogenase (short-subunit alcohol dehydrogenase family)